MPTDFFRATDVIPFGELSPRSKKSESYADGFFRATDVIFFGELSPRSKKLGVKKVKAKSKGFFRATDVISFDEPSSRIKKLPVENSAGSFYLKLNHYLYSREQRVFLCYSVCPTEIVNFQLSIVN